MVWWTSDHKRLSAERRAIEAIDGDWFENPAWSLDRNCRLRLIFDIVLPHRRFRLAMIYHNTFPASPPSVVPVSDTERISSHQYGPGGELCLSIRSDNWSPEVTGADMIRSAHLLLEAESPDEHGEVLPAPSAHDVPVELLLRHALARFYVDPESRLALAGDDLDGAPIEIGLDCRYSPYFLARLLSIGPHPPDSSPVVVGAPQALRETSLVYPGYFYFVDLPAAAIKALKTVEHLRATVGERFLLSAQTMWACVVRSSDQELLLVRNYRGSDDLYHYDTISGPLDPPRSGLDCVLLAEKKVAIVGLGSLGSKIASSLARARVGRFELVDGDILHPGNLERHDADWRDVGRHKAELMAHRLRLIHPCVEAHSWQAALGAQVSSGEAGNVHAALAACDLLVDATANPDVFNHLAFIAMRSNRTLVWGAVYAGGLGGEVARSRPGKDPSPYDIRRVMTQFYEIADEPPPLPTGRGYDGSVGQDGPLIATDADTSVVAAHMAAYSLDVLVDREPSVYEAPAYFIGLKRGWHFEGPFDTQPLIVDAPLRTTLSASDDTPVDGDFLKGLIETLTRENQDREKDA